MTKMILYPQTKIVKIFLSTKHIPKIIIFHACRSNGLSYEENLLKSISETGRYSRKNRDKKNTAFTGSTGQFSTDASSGGVSRSALDTPTDTQGVPFDSAKVRKNTNSTKNNIKIINNSDYPIFFLL